MPKCGVSAEPVLVGREKEREEVQAIVGLFEGEIKTTEQETAQETQRALRISKLLNQSILRPN